MNGRVEAGVGALEVTGWGRAHHLEGWMAAGMDVAPGDQLSNQWAFMLGLTCQPVSPLTRERDTLLSPVRGRVQSHTAGEGQSWPYTRNI